MQILILSKEIKKKLKRRKLEDITAIVLHHSAGHGSVEDVDKIHRGRGYVCIGYHYYITRDGELHCGRPIEYIGAHAKGHNKYTIGICLEGDFRKDKPTHEQLNMLRTLIEVLKEEVTTIRAIYNHRDLCKTLCPVIDLKSKVLELIEEDKNSDDNN